MKTFTCFVVFLSCMTFSSAQYFFGYEYYSERVKTGSTPTQIFTLYWDYYVIYCAGFDKNFNGVQDEGDEAPSLWSLPIEKFAFQNFLSVAGSFKITDLEFRTPSLPTRNYFDESAMTLYVLNKNSIDTIDFDYSYEGIKFNKGTLIQNIKNVSAVSAFKDKVFISVRPSMDTGYVLVYDMPTKTMIDTLPAGPGIQMTQFINDGDALIILSEGHFGKNDGKIQIAMFQDNDSIKTMEFPVGGTPNHFYYSEKQFKIYVTCNASNDIKIIDLKLMNIDTLKMHLADYDGPRESMMFEDVGVDGYLFTTAYDGNIHVFDNKGDSLITVGTLGKAESCLATGGDFIIATPFQSGTYNPDTAVTIFSRLISVENNKTKNIKIWPNPSVNSFSIDLNEDLIISDVEIVNSLGITEADYQNVESLKNLNFELPSGLYFVRIKHNGGLITLPMSVIK